MSSPQGSGTRCGVADEGHQLGVVADGEGDIVAAAAARRAAVCLDGEVSIGKQSDFERCQRERLTAPGVGSPLGFGDSQPRPPTSGFRRVVQVGVNAAALHSH